MPETPAIQSGALGMEEALSGWSQVVSQAGIAILLPEMGVAKCGLTPYMHLPKWNSEPSKTTPERLTTEMKD